MRTKLKYLYKSLGAGLAILLVLPACSKKQDIVTPTFDVSVSKTTFAVNEPITFNFTGTSDQVSFYSGASGAEYKYKDRTTVSGKPQLQFTSYRQGTSTQANTLQVLVSKDFVNVFDPDDITNAHWTDITSRTTLSTGTDNTPSGVVDLSDQLSANTPVYLAFHYTAKQDVVAQPTWTIKNITVDNIQADGSAINIGAMATLNWGVFSMSNPSNNWTTSATALTFTGGAANAIDNDDWVISQPLQLDRAPRAYSVNIKPSPTTKLVTWTFAGYIAAGTYTATFEAINSNKWDTKTTIKQFTFTVK